MFFLSLKSNEQYSLKKESNSAPILCINKAYSFENVEKFEVDNST